MNWDQLHEVFLRPVCHMCLLGAVVASWYLAQGSSPSNVMTIFLLLNSFRKNSIYILMVRIRSIGQGFRWCLSFCSQGCLPSHMSWDRQTPLPQGDRPTLDKSPTPPCQKADTLRRQTPFAKKRDGQQVGGTHPTGMHTCFLKVAVPRSLHDRMK